MVHTMIAPKPVVPGSEASTEFDAERERLHRQMLSSVSHDLKTPLASIIGALEVFERMKDKLPVEKQTTLIKVALQEAYRLDNFITNILDMARLENNMVKTNKESIEVGAVIQNCLQRLHTRLKDATIHFSVSQTIPLMTDPVLLNRAIFLVLENAVKYGGKPPVITITMGRDEDKTAFVSVQDNGNGIADGQMEVIFSKYTRFVREDQQNAGTGLGLSISRAILKLLGGTIEVQNSPNSGALFTLRVPLEPKDI